MDQSCHIDRQPCPLDTITQSLQSLDTVRALHQTVVSLRTALEDAHKEIEQLKKQIIIQTDIDEGRVYRQHQYKNVEQIETYRTLEQVTKPEIENRNLKISIPISGASDTIDQYTISDKRPKNTDQDLLQVDDKTETDDQKIIFDSVQSKGETDTNKVTSKSTTSTDKEKVEQIATVSGAQIKHKSELKKKVKYDLKQNDEHSPRIVFTPDIRIITEPSSGRKPKQMASKIDVKIKVLSNVKINDSSSASETPTDSNSVNEDPKESDNSQIDDIQSPNENTGNESPDIQIKTTDRLTIDGVSVHERLAVSKASSENIHLDNLSGTSFSEEENSVFEDDSNANIENIEEAASGTSTIERKLPKTSSENQEEVDDIELIFSSDDKEYPQEDLVSISEYEPWEKEGTSGTPVLVNFANIPSDQETSKDMDIQMQDSEENPDELDKFNSEIQPNTSYHRKIESRDNISLSVCDNKKSNNDAATNTEKDDSLDEQNDNLVRRDESFDTFDPIGTTSGMSRRWTNFNVLIETDISKCGITEDNILEMGRRNTCPNPPPYRPIIHREALVQTRHTPTRCPLASKFSRGARSQQYPSSRSPRPILCENSQTGPKQSSSAQTEISALPEHWRSESHLAGGRYSSGLYTLPSKFIPPPGMGCNRYPLLRVSDKTQEVRRALLSDINFTSMVPELSRSADHLCQEEDQNRTSNESLKKSYYKGNTLTTPDYRRGITPSASMTSPGVSQWTVNENSFGTQTTQTENYWGVHGDSFDSSKSYSMNSKYSNMFDKSHRSRSVPSIRCAICKQNHGLGLRTSESMNYAPRVTFQEPVQGVRGSLPDLRKECTCNSRRYGRSMLRILGDSSGSTESLLDEADDFLRKSMDTVGYHEDDIYCGRGRTGGNNSSSVTSISGRRCSEADIKRDYSPSKQSLPFLPKSPKCLKPGHLAKVITKTGRVVIGRVRYIGPLASTEYTDNDTFVGLQLPNKVGDCDGSIDGRKFFDCEPQQGVFVPFKKIVMAWTA